jgi:hypothetical protein
MLGNVKPAVARRRNRIFARHYVSNTPKRGTVMEFDFRVSTMEELRRIMFWPEKSAPQRKAKVKTKRIPRRPEPADSVRPAPSRP